LKNGIITVNVTNDGAIAVLAKGSPARRRNTEIDQVIKNSATLFSTIGRRMIMVDDIDLKLIKCLQENGRLSHIELAKKLDVVEGTVRRRIKQLIDGGVMKIVAIPRMQELGYGFMTIVGIQVRMSDLRNVADSLAANKHICYLAFVTGRHDLLAVVLTRTAEEYSRFLQEEISALPSVLRTETFVNLEIIKGNWQMIDTSEIVDSLNESFSSESLIDK
jgi:DNA-binding Lrp family transcriptional regulator